MTGGAPSRVSFAEQRSSDLEDHGPQDCQRRGNEVAMVKIVDSLYDKVLHDPKLIPFFAGIDVHRIQSHQEKLMTLVFGGQDLLLADTPEFDMRAIHIRSLVEDGLSLEHWELFVGHFQKTLDNLPALPVETRTSAMEWMRSTRHAFRAPEAEEIEVYRAGAGSAAGGAARGCPFGHQ